MSDDRGVRGPDESASVKDSDFEIESYSDKQAFAPTPSDTTSDRVDDAQPEAIVDEISGDPDEALAHTVDAAGAAAGVDDGQVSASRSATPPETTPAAKSKNKVPLAKRTAQLKHEVDTLTHQKHRAKSEYEAEQRRLETLRREIADHEAKLRGASPDRTPAAGTPAQTDAELPMPEFPDYRKFATDEDYDVAKAKYHTDLAAWQRSDRDRFERRITSGVEARFQSVGTEAAAVQAERTLMGTLEKVRSGKGKAEWDDKVASLQGITSSWYDPTKHGEATTPFLSDLARTRMAMGLEDGAELLYWLGSDPDRAQAVADLIPNRPIRDAVVHAPSVIPLLDYFATDEGQREFEALRQMHPLRINQAIGALSVRLVGASSGSPARPHPITKAQPSARPPAGTPGARGTTEPPKKVPFDEWMAAEDAKERAARERVAGIGAR